MNVPELSYLVLCLSSIAMIEIVLMFMIISCC